MRELVASAIFLAVSMQASATILSFTAPPIYPDFNAGAGFTATQAFGNAGHFFKDWADVWRLSIDGHAPALTVLVTVPQNPVMSLAVASVWLRGPGSNAELPSTFTCFSTHAGEKRFEMGFDSPLAGEYTLELFSGSNASGGDYIQISEVPEPSAAVLAALGVLAIGRRLQKRRHDQLARSRSP